MLFDSWMDRPRVAGRAAQFFNGVRKGNNVVSPWSLGDFMRHLKTEGITEWQPQELAVVCHALCNKGVLQRIADDPSKPIMGTTYFSPAAPAQSLVQYGQFDFLVYGLRLVYKTFKDSVLAIDVEKVNGDPSIGTAFLAQTEEHGVVVATARHCIEGVSRATIVDWDMMQIPCRKVLVPENPAIDVALLIPRGSPFEGQAPFRFSSGTELDRVLTMGYPPIPGFTTPLIAEEATIASRLKATTGKVAAKANSYLAQQELLLISARVKGGNSGGPVISEKGEVIGIVTDSPDADGVIDQLGYGVVTPFESFRDNMVTVAHHQVDDGLRI